jgi:hypothetical protein
MGSTDSSRKSFGPPIAAIVGTVLGVVAWLVFIIVFALYWSRSYNLFQDVVVTVASFLIDGVLIAAMWIIWIFSSGTRHMWWNAEYEPHLHKHRHDNEVLSPVQRAGEALAVFIILLIIAFFGYNQIANTGFFTSKFDSWEMTALYGSFLFATTSPFVRAVVGLRNPVRPLEAASNLIFAVSTIFLLTTFPFNFAHFADVLPSAVRPAFFWVTNDMAKLAFILVIVGCLIGGAVNIAKYLAFVTDDRVGRTVEGRIVTP